MQPTKTTPTQEAIHVSAGRQPLSVVSKTCAAALLGNGLAYIIEYIVAISVGLSASMLLPLVFFALIAWITAGLILLRMRWASIAGTIIGLVSFLYLAVPATRSGLLHPARSPLHFDLLVAIFACALIAIVSGLLATLQRNRRTAPSVPGWLRPLLIGLVSLVIGMMVLASIVSANPQSNQANTNTNGMPTVHAAGDNFTTNVVLVPKGQSLVITDDDGVEHIIQNGSWSASGTPQQQAEPGAPAVHSLNLNSGSLTIGPFTTAGVFHLYCPIHRGMNLTVVVQ